MVGRCNPAERGRQGAVPARERERQGGNELEEGGWVSESVTDRQLPSSSCCCLFLQLLHLQLQL